MPRRFSILLACLALGFTLGCRQTQDEPAATVAESSTEASYDEVKSETRKAYMAAEGFDEKLSIAGQFLDRFPQAEDLADIAGLVAKDGIAAERADEAFEFIDQRIGQADDPDLRFDTRMQLVRSYGQLGRGEELRTLAVQLAEERPLLYREIDAIAEAAIAAEDWQLALEQSEASLAFASPAHYKQDTPAASDEIAQTYGTRRVAYSLANKGWAQFNLGQIEAAFESFARAKESTTFNFLGVDDTQLHRYWGQALLRHGQPEKAMELLATEALFGVDPTAGEAYRQAYAASHSEGQHSEGQHSEGQHSEGQHSETGFEEHLWNLRRQIARAVPDFALPTYDGETVRLSQFQGDVVLLVFWFPT